MPRASRKFDGNCESYRRLDQLVAPICAAREGIVITVLIPATYWYPPDKRHRQKILEHTSYLQEFI